MPLSSMAPGTRETPLLHPLMPSPAPGIVITLDGLFVSYLFFSIFVLWALTESGHQEVGSEGALRGCLFDTSECMSQGEGKKGLGARFRFDLTAEGHTPTSTRETYIEEPKSEKRSIKKKSRRI